MRGFAGFAQKQRSERRREPSEWAGLEPLLPSPPARAPLHVPALGVGLPHEISATHKQSWNPVIKSMHSCIFQMRKVTHWLSLSFQRFTWVSQWMPEWELAHRSLLCAPIYYRHAGIILEPITGLLFPLPGHCLVEKGLSGGPKATENIPWKP